MKLNYKNICTVIVFIFAIATISYAAIGQSAVITLSFPFGARSTGLGETFTGVADDVSALFYNPAGLGQSPLANAWKIHYPVPANELSAIVAKHKRDFGNKERIWVGSNTKGLFLFNGRVWTSYDTYVIEEGDNLQDIAEKFLTIDDEKIIKKAIRIIKKTNNIEMKRHNLLVANLTPNLKDSIKKLDNSNQIVEDLADKILKLDEFSRNSAQVYGLISSNIDSVKADSLSNELAQAFNLGDVQFSDLVELEIPFSIAIQDSITSMALDPSDRLWIGTNKGLWRFDGSSWHNYTILDGLPSNRIINISIGDKHAVAVATDLGVGILTDGEWKSYGVDEGLSNAAITSIAFAENNVLFAGTNSGLLQFKNDQWIHYDTSSGLLSQQISALMFDSEKKLWIGGLDGITVYDEIAWKRYKFPGSQVSSFTEYKPGRIWIGTNRGAITYKAGKIRTDKSGNSVQDPPKWKPFHSKNSLEGNQISDITVHGKDVWLATDEAVCQLDRGDRQVTVFFEPLLPAFDIPDLWHAALGAVIPTEDWGTIGAYLNYLNFGKNTQYDAQGREVDNFQSFEFVFALGYGIPLSENSSIGLNVKYAHSALAPGIGEGSEGVGRTFAIDVAVLRRNLLLKNLDIGFTIMNMGPAVFYVSQEQKDPIPFTLRFGIGYTPVKTPVHTLMFAVDLDREIVNNDAYSDPDPFWKAFITGLNDEPWKEELKEIIGHMGLEYWYVNFLALRMGYMIDLAGSRKEISFGLGLRYGNLRVDWSYISSKKGSVARDGQWRFSFTFAQ